MKASQRAGHWCVRVSLVLVILSNLFAGLPAARPVLAADGDSVALQSLTPVSGTQLSAGEVTTITAVVAYELASASSATLELAVYQFGEAAGTIGRFASSSRVVTQGNGTASLSITFTVPNDALVVRAVAVLRQDIYSTLALSDFSDPYPLVAGTPVNLGECEAEIEPNTTGYADVTAGGVDWLLHGIIGGLSHIVSLGLGFLLADELEFAGGPESISLDTYSGTLAANEYKSLGNLQTTVPDMYRLSLDVRANLPEGAYVSLLDPYGREYRTTENPFEDFQFSDGVLIFNPVAGQWTVMIHGGATPGDYDISAILWTNSTYDCDTIPPIFDKGPNVTVNSESSATISWSTDEPTRGVLDYGTSASYGSSQEDAAYAYQHAITLNGLIPGSLYHYRVQAWDPNGNGPLASGDRTFLLTTQAARNIDVVLIIDSSGSMTLNDPQNQRLLAANVFIDAMEDNDQVAVIDFDDYASVVWPLQTLSPARDAVKSVVSSIDSSGGTDIGLGLGYGYSALLGSTTSYPKYAILLTDGDGGYANEADLYAQKGWKIFTIGLGTGPNAILLQEIASQTGGKYYALSDPGMLTQVYADILGIATYADAALNEVVALQPGEEQTHAVDVPQGQSTLSVVVTWPGSRVDAHLVDPTGLIINPDVAAFDPDIEHSSGTTFELYRVSYPRQGQWRLVIYGAELPAGGEPVTLQVHTRGEKWLYMPITVHNYTSGSSASNAPPVVSNPAPAMQTSGNSLSLDLSWSAYDADGDPMNYDVYFEAADRTPDALVAIHHPEASVTVSGLTAATHYFWQIVARDDQGGTAAGPIWDFYTSAAPEAPHYPSPADGSTGQTTDVLLSWQGGDPDGDALRYDVYLEADDPSPDVLVCSDVAAASCDPGELETNLHYYWRVVAKDPDGALAGSAAWDFSTEFIIPEMVSIDSRGSHFCALSEGGGLFCWGANGQGQLGDGTTTNRSYPRLVSGLGSGVIDFALGSGHTCALTSLGGVKCWGDNYDGQLGDGSSYDHTLPTDVLGLTSGVVDISAGLDHTCAVTAGGSVYCWGWNLSGQLGDGTTITSSEPVSVIGLAGAIVSVHAGDFHTCARDTSGGALCWGFNSYGQLGNGTTTSSSIPVAVTGLSSGVLGLDADYTHSCALVSGGGVKCWGSNSEGQLGTGGTSLQTTPVDVAGLTSGASQVDTGDNYSCAALADGSARCWGANQSGQLGDGSTLTQLSPVAVAGLSGPIRLLAAGSASTCAILQDGMLECWGSNSVGQLGLGTVLSRSTPQDVPGMASGMSQVLGGNYFTCALDQLGGVKCWGYNASGQLGNNTTDPSSSPVTVSGLESGVIQIAVGAEYACALTQSGGVLCWGDNDYGQLGDGTYTSRAVPAAVNGLSSGVASIGAGDYHMCAVTTGGAAYCWGNNEYGRLGDDTTTTRTTPVGVTGLSSGVLAIQGGYLHTCALTTGGGVKCWGGNNFGQLGNGSYTSSRTPVDVSGLTSGVSQMWTSGLFGCARLSGGGLMCWGDNRFGQIGNGDNTNQTVPVAVSGLATGVASVRSGTFHACAVTTGGGLLCWGENASGELGDGTTASRNVPGSVAGFSSGAAASGAGRGHTCAITTGGGLKCWGSDAQGQLGLGTLVRSLVPLAVYWP